MTRSALAEKVVQLGLQEPRFESLPVGEPNKDSRAALELVEAAGVHLFPWQKRVFAGSLRRRNDLWAASSVGLVCPRQNGKNEIILARELAGLFLFNEKLIMHTAHEANTANKAFERLVTVIDANEWLRRELKGKPHWSRGNESLELKSGSRIEFKTRTSGGGRGYSGSTLVFDEAMFLPDTFVGTTLPTLSAYPDPQTWYTGSSVDQRVHRDGLVLAKLRQNALTGGKENLAFWEWSAHALPDELTDADLADPAIWAQANPSLGYLVTARNIIDELESPMGRQGFLAERLGGVIWPDLGEDGSVISVEAWNLLFDRDSSAKDPVTVAFDMSPDGTSAAICIAGSRPVDDLTHLEVIDHRPGTDWVVPQLRKVVDAKKTTSVLYAKDGPGKALVPALETAGVRLTPVEGGQHSQACGMIQEAVKNQTVRHLGTPEMVSALRGAAKRPIGDAWGWSRKNSLVDISPLVGCTLAHWGAATDTYKEPWIAWR